MVDETEAHDPAAVSWLINKTRYVDDAFAGGFSNLRGIVVLAPEAWMVKLESAAHVRVETIDQSRGYEVAEHAMALLLAGLKRLPNVSINRRKPSSALRTVFTAPLANEARGAHNWSHAVTDTIYRRNVGIVGYGLIGREIHKRLAGFEPRVFYHHRNRYPQAIEHALAMTYLPLDELFATCDAIFVQLPLTEATDGLISAEILARARNNLVLVNCGRAGVIAEDALYDALRRNEMACYAADVFWREPIPYVDRFRRLDNCIFTPHMAESLPDRRHDLLDRALAKIAGLEGNIHDRPGPGAARSAR